MTYYPLKEFFYDLLTSIVGMIKIKRTMTLQQNFNDANLNVLASLDSEYMIQVP